MDYRNRIRLYLDPRWGARPVASIAPAEVAKSPVTDLRLLTVEELIVRGVITVEQIEELVHSGALSAEEAAKALGYPIEPPAETDDAAAPDRNE